MGQVFFSIGVCMGVMTAYSSFRRPEEGCIMDAAIISLSDSVISFFAGLVVYATIGYLAHEEGTTVKQAESGH